ncbi:MAG: ferritin-like domain-containing protein [Planctomycetia bacterium]|nr:ferritin-like domain-containing protein [Planctomycetia bacterium]
MDAKIRSSHEWCQYFLANAGALLEIAWEQGAGVTAVELDAIAESVREFQLGENAEGRHFVGSAKAYAARSGDYEYIDAVRLLIGEEQRHARTLAKFLELAGVPVAQRTTADALFRWLRKRAGLEICVSVLLSAEVIAKVYYAALHDATGSPVLRRVCEQILRDEVEHVRFQAQRLALLRAGRPRILVLLGHAAHRAAFAGACLVVWWKHGRAMRAGGFGFRRYWREAWREMRQALVEMDPRRVRPTQNHHRGTETRRMKRAMSAR